MLNVLNADESSTKLQSRAAPEIHKLMQAWLEERIAASKKRPSAEVVTLVPVLAQQLLDRNPVNRPVNRRNSADLASDIVSGRFEFNGESIIVSNTGVLLDGQHRCQQVLATGTPIETVICFGPKEAARFTIDTGKSKTVANFLSMKGRSYSHILGPAASYYLQWSEHGIVSPTGDARVPTKQAVLAAIDELKGLDISVEFTSTAIKSPVRSHAVLAFCHYVFKKKAGAEAADHFIGKVIEGNDLKRGDAVLYCRNRLMAANSGIRSDSRIELIFKCWNAYRLGHSINHLKLNGGKLPKIER